MQTYIKSISSTGTQGASFDCADYTDAVIRVTGIWDGSIEFLATNYPINGNTALAVQDLSSTNWTTAVTSEAGSSPSPEIRTFRVPVAGLTSITVLGASGWSGAVTICVTLVSNTNAR